MQFAEFARAHGVLLDSYPPIGVWRRFKTEDKPRSRNGAVKFMGDHGFVQNWATMTEAAVWTSDGESRIGKQEIQRIASRAESQIREAQAKAAQKAEWILSQCELATHEYLKSKGFPEEFVNVWVRDGVKLAVIPMRIGQQIVGCQLISEDGDKKFLGGQRTSYSTFNFTNGGKHYLCEGYATALSVQHALRQLKRPYSIRVCFSAGNMKKVAERMKERGMTGVVIADNDASQTGERTAKEIAWPYWMSDCVGEDANDYALRAGYFKLGQGIIRL